jgi:hypothetical protein
VRPGSAGSEEFAARVAVLRDAHARLWGDPAPRLPSLGPRTGPLSRLRNARAAERLVGDVATGLARLPDDDCGRHAWREEVRRRLIGFGAARLGWPPAYARLLLGDALLETSLAFAREARDFDPTLPREGLCQALRNVWIGNALQMLLRRPVRLGEGLFAYSMMYPLTDNILDDPQLDGRTKRALNESFGRRLAGDVVTPSGPREEALFALVARIEMERPRERFPRTYAALLAIHGAQIRSLQQQTCPSLSDAELLSISAEKGGTSVLADLHLVAADVTPAEESFAFGYGVCLQLLDDFQDVEADRAAGHQTLFTRAAARGALDEATRSLAALVDRVLAHSSVFADPESSVREDFVRRSCHALLVATIADRPRGLSRGLRRSVERQWPFSLRAVRRLRRRAEHALARAAAHLRARGVRTPPELAFLQPGWADARDSPEAEAGRPRRAATRRRRRFPSRLQDSGVA